MFRCSNEYNVKMKKVFLVIVINVRGTYNRNYREVKFIKVLKKQILDFLESVQAVDKCRNCICQQPVLMRKSAKNVII